MQEERGPEVAVETVVDWTRARCATGNASLLNLFFSEDEAEIRRAKEICTSCPLQRPCFEGAVNRREPWGVWGGELFDRGVPIARKRTRGRPRKTVAAPPAAAAELETEVA